MQNKRGNQEPPERHAQERQAGHQRRLPQLRNVRVPHRQSLARPSSLPTIPLTVYRAPSKSLLTQDASSSMKRMGLKALLPIALLLLTLVPSALPLVNSDIGPTQRTFYLTSSKFLLPSVPKPGLPTIANLTQTSQPRIEFDLSQFLFTQTATISGSMVFSLYLTSNVTLPGVSLVGSFLEKLAGQTGFYINVTSVQSHPIDSTRLQPLNFTYSIPSQTLGLGAHVSISMQLASPIPKGGYQTLLRLKCNPLICHVAPFRVHHSGSEVRTRSHT